MKNFSSTTLVLFGLCFPALGCASPPEPKAPTSEVKTVTFSVPVVTPVSEGTETQGTKAMSVSLVPDSFQIREHHDKRCVPVHDESGGSSLGGLVSVKSNSGDADLKIYELTSDKHYTVEPNVVSFRLTFVNQSQQQLYLEKITPRLNINNRTVNLGEKEISDMHQTVLLPGDTVNFTLVGPQWDPTVESAQIDFRVAGVPVETDAAENVTDRDEFRWTYKAVVEKKTVEVEKKTEQLKLASTEARQMGCPVAAAQTDTAATDEGSGSGLSIGSSGGNK